MDRRLLTVLIAIVTARILLLHHAVRSLPDEYFYNYSLFALSHLRDFNFQLFFHEIFEAVRPGYNMISLIPASLQTILYLLFDLDPRSTLSLLVPQVCNGLVNVLSLVIYYRILELYIPQKRLVAIFVIAYALLVHSTLYTVHLLPYDYAQCLLLWVTYAFLRMHKNEYVPRTRSIILYASALAWVFLVYPGYYQMIPFFFVFLLLLLRRQVLKERIASFLTFSGVFFLNLFLFQLLSLWGNTSYFIKCQRLSRSILQGSFEEGFSFIFKYFADVEHMPFIFLALGLVVYLWKETRSARTASNLWRNGLFLLFVYTLMTYTWNGINIYFLHKQVNYGRLLHPYYPVIFACIFVAVSSFRTTYAFGFAVIFAVGILANLFAFYGQALSVAYPLFLAQKYNIDIQGSQKLYTHTTPVPYSSHDSVCQDQKLVLMNFSYFTDLQFAGQLTSVVRDTIYLKRHFINLKPYQYDGYNVVERQTLDRHPVYIGIFRK